MKRVSSIGKTKIGLVQFLGSNCDWDCIDSMKRHYGIEVKLIWHTATSLPEIDGLILPGGFSYGDFLRSGALASHTRIISSVKDFVKKGGSVIGICNGFQILTESHLLPGALLKNTSGKFICRYLNLKVAAGSSVFHKELSSKTLNIPIAHGEGRYFISPDGLNKLKENGQILFQYEQNPNGSIDDIAGILSENHRVLGMMPHPERATDQLLSGSSDGSLIWNAFLRNL